MNIDKILKKTPQIYADTWPYIFILFLIYIVLKFGLFSYPNSYFGTLCLNVSIPKEVRWRDRYDYCRCIGNPNTKLAKENKIIKCNHQFIKP